MNATRAFSVAVLALTASGPHKPAPIVYNADSCDYCRMQISDPRFGAELVTKTGRTIKFDSIECLLAFYKQAANAGDVESVWVPGLHHPATLVGITDPNDIKTWAELQ